LLISKEGCSFSPNQALIAAKLGATCVSPLAGRFDDISRVGMDLIEDLVRIFSKQAVTEAFVCTEFALDEIKEAVYRAAK